MMTLHTLAAARTSGSVTYTTWGSKGSAITLSNGDLTYSGTGLGHTRVIKSFSSGDKKHWELKINDNDFRIGMAQSTANLEQGLGGPTDSIGYVGGTGIVKSNSGDVATYALYVATDRITFEFNASATLADRTLQIFKNGVSQGTITQAMMVAATGSFAGTWFAAGATLTNPSGATLNAGATTFLDTPTAGFDGIQA